MRILILFPREYWTRKMSLVRRSAIRWMLRDKRLECHLTGQGWRDWDDSLTVQQNADRLLPGADVAFSYKPLGHAKRGIPPLKEPEGFQGIRCETFNESHDPSIVQDAVRAGTNLAILHLQNSEPEWKGTGIRTVHIPHCADPELFAASAKPWGESHFPVLLTGTLSPEVYPLRCRLARLIESGRIRGYIYPHPGNYLHNLEESDRQERRYATLLGHAKLHLGCTSRFHYRLARIPEAAMAGCCVMSDLPDQDIDEHAGFIREIRMSMTDDELVDAVHNAIEHDETSRLRAEWGQSVMLSNYTMRRYVSKLIQSFQGHR